MHAERQVTVCSICLRASCWHGEFMCEFSAGASTVEKPVSELGRLNREHPHHYSKANVERVCGADLPPLALVNAPVAGEVER